jgi:pimeloyl-ACP methyl ester carboxylesterase
METITSADGTGIAFERTGQGPPLVLVHGTGRDHVLWASCLPHLAPYTSVYAVDRRGRGASADAPEYALAREVEDLLAVLATLGQPAHLFGHSYGAIVALEAATRTERLQSVILYEPPLTVGPDWLPPDLGEELAAILAIEGREAVLVHFMRQAVRYSEEAIAAQRAQPDWPARVAAAHTLPREAQTVRHYPFAPAPLAGLRVPTLLLLGVRARPSSGSPSRRWRRRCHTARCGCWPGSITTRWRRRLRCWPRRCSTSCTQNPKRPRPARGGQRGSTVGSENQFHHSWRRPPASSCGTDRCAGATIPWPAPPVRARSRPPVARASPHRPTPRPTATSPRWCRLSPD